MVIQQTKRGEIHIKMNETQLQLFFIKEVEGNTHKTQRNTILKLLEGTSFVPTQLLNQMGIYQYNARIYELRRLGYDIHSTQKDGVYGFELRC